MGTLEDLNYKVQEIMNKKDEKQVLLMYIRNW